MFPRLRGAWGPSRRVAFAVVPAVLGAVLLLTGDPRSPGPSRLEATQARVPDLLEGPTSSTTLEVPAQSAPDSSPGGTAATSDPLAQDVAPTTALPVAPTASGPAATGGRPEGLAPAPDGSPATAESTSAPSASSGATPTGGPTTTTTSPASREEARTTTTVTTTVVAPSGPVRNPSVEAEVVPLTNRDRTAEGLGPLTRNGCLDGVASGYAQQLARSGVLAHNPGAGAAVTQCRPGATWGDNVGTAGPCSASLLEERWMASPSHRRNILTGVFQYVGVGAWTDPAGACWVQVLFSS